MLCQGIPQIRLRGLVLSPRLYGKVYHGASRWSRDCFPSTPAFACVYNRFFLSQCFFLFIQYLTYMQSFPYSIKFQFYFILKDYLNSHRSVEQWQSLQAFFLPQSMMHGTQDRINNEQPLFLLRYRRSFERKDQATLLNLPKVWMPVNISFACQTDYIFLLGSLFSSFASFLIHIRISETHHQMELINDIIVCF